MPDWNEYVRRNLSLPELTREREDEIREDLARQFEQAYRDALSHGATEDKAAAHARSHVPDWESFISDVYRSERRHARSRLANWQEQSLEPSRKGERMMGKWISDLRHDVLYGLRMLRKNPGFTTVAVLTLALGIGANTIMFSIVNGVLLRPLPYSEPSDLVRINPKWNDSVYGTISPRAYYAVLEQAESFRNVAIYRFTSINLTGGEGEPERVSAVGTTASLFEALKVRPALGRPLQAGEEIHGNHRVVLLSNRLWRRRFGSDPAVVGRTVRISDVSAEVIGVMPPSFAYPDKEVDIWIGLGITEANKGIRCCNSSILARLRDGSTLATAQAELNAISAGLRKEFPDSYPEETGVYLSARPLTEVLTGSVRPALLILMGVVGFVLLIACANVANLLLARITAREKEIAVRVALGAGTGRIRRQILTETFLLSLLGGLGALAFAAAAFMALGLLHPESVPRLDEVKLGPAVLLFNAGVIFLATLAVGLIPATRLSRLTLHEKLKDGGRESGSDSRRRTRAALVVVEVALATVLLAGAGLLIRSFQQLLAVDPGFRAENVLTTQLALTPNRYPDQAARAEFYRRLTEELEAKPGVIAAAVVSFLPMSGLLDDLSIAAEGYTPPNPDVPDFTEHRLVTPNYFKALGIPVLKGRAFAGQDTADNQPVAILSESLARRFWGEQDPIGRRVQPGGLQSEQPWHTVVGVVGEVHHSGAREGLVPIWYKPVYQQAWNWMHLAVRTERDPALAVPLVKETVRGIDPNQPIFDTKVMTQMVAASISQDRFNANLLIAFAGLALSLAVIGIYGVISYSVSQRTREIGIRMALGAQTGCILRQVIGEGLTLVLIGLGLGLAGALALTRALQSLLFQVKPTDPTTFLAIAAVLLAAGTVACVVPARRATKVDPMVALRYE